MSSHDQPLRVTIVGGGLGGLACAIACRKHNFEVTLFEKVQEFQRLGDSIGFGPNSARLLYRWGLGEDLARIASNAKGMTIHNYDNSDIVLGVDAQLGESEPKYGCRSLIGHRGDFHLIFLEHCRKAGVDIRMGQNISEYDSEKPSIILDNGEEIISDVILCVDGVKSKGREMVLGFPDRPLASGYAIYRAFMNGDLIRDDPIAGKFVNNGDSIHLFLAPDAHGFITSLRDGKEINAVLTHKDSEDIVEDWGKPGRTEDVLKLTEGWDPAFVRVWEKMPSCIDWKLVYRPCLNKWVADSGLVSIIGDAAHPFLPTSTQGASQAIEDGATIAMCLAKAGKDNIPLALHTCFEIRHDYVAEAQSSGIKQRDDWHNLHDKDSKQFKEDFDITKSALGTTYLWSNDAEKVVEEQWNEVSTRVQKRLKTEARL